MSWILHLLMTNGTNCCAIKTYLFSQHRKKTKSRQFRMKIISTIYAMHFQSFHFPDPHFFILQIWSTMRLIHLTDLNWECNWFELSSSSSLHSSCFRLVDVRVNWWSYRDELHNLFLSFEIEGNLSLDQLELITLYLLLSHLWNRTSECRPDNLKETY